jgi:hypothetical protein
VLCQFLDGFSPEAFKVTGPTGLGTVPAVDLNDIFTDSIKRLNRGHSVFVREARIEFWLSKNGGSKMGP